MLRDWSMRGEADAGGAGATRPMALAGVHETPTAWAGPAAAGTPSGPAWPAIGPAGPEGQPLVELLRAVWAAGFEAGKRAGQD